MNLQPLPALTGLSVAGNTPPAPPVNGHSTFPTDWRRLTDAQALTDGRARVLVTDAYWVLREEWRTGSDRPPMTVIEDAGELLGRFVPDAIEEAAAFVRARPLPASERGMLEAYEGRAFEMLDHFAGRRSEIEGLKFRSQRLEEMKTASRLKERLEERELQRLVDAEMLARRFPYAKAIEGAGFSCAADDYDTVMAERVEMLVKGFLPANTDAALGAEFKAGKTFLAADLAVSLCAGVPFLGEFAVPKQRRVMVMVNEGKRKAYYRKITAIAEHKGLDVRRDVLPRLFVQVGASVLTDPDALARFTAQVMEFKPDLVIIDPWYLSAGEADGKSLSNTGMVLRNLSGIARAANTALLITAHWNKSGAGAGVSRWSGVGLQEWGRVLINVTAVTSGPKSRSQDPTGRTHTVNMIELIGEMSGAYAVERDVWADDRDDEDSPMHYESVCREVDGDAVAADGPTPAEKAQLVQDEKNELILYRILDFIGTAAMEPPTERMVIQGALGKGGGMKTSRKAQLDIAVECGWVEGMGEAPALVGGKFVDPELKPDDTKIVGRSKLVLTKAGLQQRKELAEKLSAVNRFTGAPAGPLAPLQGLPTP